MSEVKRLAHNTIWQFSGKIISTFLGLIAIAIMTRTLGVEKFGWYATAIGFLQFIGIFTDFGFTVVTSSMLSKPKHDKQQLLNNLFSWRLITALITQGLVPLTIFFFPYPAPVKWAVIIMAISFIGVSLNQIFIAYYQTKLTLYIQAIGEIIGRVVLVIGLTLVPIFNLGFLSMMAVITIGSLSYTAYLWFKIDKIKFELDKKISLDILKNIWPVALAVIFNCFYLQSDRLILPLYTSQVEVGLYVAAYRVIDICMQISTMLMGMFLPLIAFAYSRGDQKKFKEQSQRGFDLTALFILPIVAGVLAIAKPIMIFVAGSDFSASGDYLKIQILLLIGLIFGTVFGYIILAVGKQKQALWIYLIDAVLSLIAYFILISKFSGFGAAWVRVGSEFFAGIGLLFLTYYYTKFWPKLFNFLKIILASTLMGLLVWYLQPLNIFISIIIGFFSYTILILAFKVISKQTILEVIKSKQSLPNS